MGIFRQEFYDLKDDKDTVVLRNYYDCSAAIDLAKIVNGNGGPQMGKRSDDCECLGFIPNEEWLYDFRLIAARHALWEGDRGQYTRWILQYFKDKKAFATPHQRIYWRGSSAVLL